MTTGMDKLTQRAKRVLSIGHQEAERLRHSYVGTEHLLLGMIMEEGGVAARVLRELGLRTQRVKELVERLAGPGDHRGGSIELAPGMQQVLQYAFEEAKTLGKSYVSTEHLLLGLIRLDDSISMNVLRKTGLTPDQIRRQTRRVLQEGTTTERAPRRRRRRARAPEGSSLLSSRDFIIKAENIPSNFEEGIEIDSSNLPESLLYIQYLVKEYYKLGLKRSVQSEISKKEGEEVVSDFIDPEYKLSAFDLLHLALFQINDLLEARNFNTAFELVELLNQEALDYFLSTMNSEASRLLENLDMLKDGIEESKVNPIIDILQSLDTSDYENPRDFADKITKVSDSIEKLVKPEIRIVAKVIVFPHGHRDVIGMNSEDTLEDLSQKLLEKYRDEIAEYLFKLYRLRIPLAEWEIKFFSDCEDQILNEAPLLQRTAIKDISNISTDGVTWYPEWLHHEKYKKHPKQTYEISINSINIPSTITNLLRKEGIDTVGRLIEIHEVGDRLFRDLGLNDEQIQAIETILTQQEFI